MITMLKNGNPDITVTSVPNVFFRQKSSHFTHYVSVRKEYGLAFVKSGSLLCTFQNEKCIARTGDLLLLHKHETYYISNNPYEPDSSLCEFYSIQFDVLESQIPLLNRLTPIQNYDIMLKLFHKLYVCVEGQALSCNIIAKKLLYEILAEAFNAYYSTAIQSSVQKSIDKAKQFIDTHYMEKITISQISRVSGYSLSHFKRIFHQYYAMSPLDYITMVRLEKAKSMLLSGLFNLDEIAEACGFSSASYFARVFRKATGHSPKKYYSQARDD